MIKKLQQKFILVSMLSTFLVLAVIISAINILNYHKVLRDAETTLLILSENNGHFPQKEPPHQENELSKPPGISSPFSKDISPELPYESRYFSVILSPNGDILSTDTGKIAAIAPSEASQYALQVWNEGKSSGFFQDYRYLRKTTKEHTQLIFLDCGRSLSNFRSFFLSSILVSAFGLGAVLFLVSVFSKMVTNPISESYEKQRQFITDAGHEIKTPLTIIDANAEIMEMEYGDSEWLEGIRSQTSRLASLTNGLIYLSRMEESRQRLPRITFSLSDLVEETVLSFQPLADTQNKSFTADIEPLLSFHGEESSIRHLISILLDNALKYSPENGIIEVLLHKKGKRLRLSVRNSVDFIEKEHLSRLFERFYRTDNSRNSKTGGYGIGLSIAKAVVDSHRGKITAQTSDGHSLEITVIL